jgi:hypothetical protein
MAKQHHTLSDNEIDGIGIIFLNARMARILLHLLYFYFKTFATEQTGTVVPI